MLGCGRRFVLSFALLALALFMQIILILHLTSSFFFLRMDRIIMLYDYVVLDASQLLSFIPYTYVDSGFG